MKKTTPGQKPPVVAVQVFTVIQSQLPAVAELPAQTASPRIPPRVRAAIRSLGLLVLAPLAVVFDRGMNANAESKLPATRAVLEPVALPLAQPSVFVAAPAHIIVLCPDGTVRTIDVK
jgi:hypothetical protein